MFRFFCGRSWLAMAVLCLGWVADAPGSELVRELAAGRARTVVVYGTSLTASGGWVGQMQSWLTSTYGGALTLVNSGLSGKNSAEGVAQLSAKVLNYQPDTVFLEFAVNDAFRYSDGTPSLSVAEARANLNTMIDRIRAANPRAEVILQTMNPAWDSPTGSNASATLRPDLAAYYQMYREVAAARGLLLVDHFPNWVTLQTNELSRFQSYVPDGVHPTATATLAIVLPLLKSRLAEPPRVYPAATPAPSLVEAEVCVYGGSSAAVAAAVQVARQGKSVVLLTPDAWVGGLSTNGLGWTDLGDASSIGGLAKEFYHRIYTYYLDDTAWTAETRATYVGRAGLVPDTARQVMFTFEPKVARGIFEQMLAEAGVQVLAGRLDRSLGGVRKTGARLREIATDDGTRVIRASMFIDATYEGDLMAAAGVSYAVGREANSAYGETLNGIQTARASGNQLPGGVDPYVVPGDASSGLLPGVNASAGGADGSADARLQAYTYRLCLTDATANKLPVPKPADYVESDYELLFRAIAAGQTSGFFKTSPMPNKKTDSNNSAGASTDFIGGNYNLAEGWNYAEASYAGRAQILAAHTRYEQGFVWALQNSPRVPSAVQSAWTKWGLPRDEFLETGGWPGQLYVREGRRMKSDLVITQRHVDQASGYVLSDPVGLGGYNMDSHHAQRYVNAQGVVKNEGDIQVAPAQGPYGISYRAMTPKAAEAENLLVPVCVSATHIAYGSIRMEPVFMILGQSAGAAAVRALNDGVPVQAVTYAALRRDLLAARQTLSTTATPSGSEIIVDNGDVPASAITGTWTSGSLAGAYNSNYLHDVNTGQGTKRITYTPTLPQAGTYEVFARWPTNANRATNARFDIVSAAGTTVVLQNQQQQNNTWVSLGSYFFAAGTAGSVTIRNDGANGYVIADAVRWVSPDAVPQVSLVATVPETSEPGGVPGQLAVMRDGVGTTALDVALVYGGTASSGIDYKALPALVTIPAGSISATVAVQAFPDALVEGVETVTATIAATSAYTVAAGLGSATVRIAESPLDRWKVEHFTPAELGDTQWAGRDADEDGVGNWAEFALGMNPRASEPAMLPEVRQVAGELRLYYGKGPSALGYEVQQAGVPSGPWTHDGVSAERYDRGLGRWYQGVPAGGVKFLRLQVGER